MATAKGYTDDDRKRIVSAMQSMRDRLGGFLAKTYGDNFDGDIDTMLEAVNFMKALRFEKPAAAVPDGYALVPVADLESLAFTDFGRAFWTDGAEAAALRIRAVIAAAARKGE